MKINFKKIATVLGSAVMIGSTLGMAAAASYPAPFVQSGAANVAVVVGANAALSDAVAATNIGSNLATQLAAQTATGSTATGATASGGDSYKLEKTSTKFRLGNGILEVVSGTVTDDNLPTLLADGVFLDSNNDEFDFTQKIVLANSSVTMFDDDDYKADTPTIGMAIADGAPVLNYTLTFTDMPYWNKLTSTNLKLLGKTYFVLSTNSPTNTTMTLLDSATTTTLNEGESKTLTIDGKTYDVSIAFIGETQVKLLVNGQTTNSLAEAQTQKLSDGAFVGVKDILVQNYAGGSKQVEFSIGSGKLKLVSGQDVEMNDNTISGLKSTFTNSSGQLQTVTLAWSADQDLFATTDSSIDMPGFKAVKLSFGGMSFPTEETFSIEKDSDSIALKNFPIKDATVSINLVYSNDSLNITSVGKQATGSNTLRTVQGGNLTFDSDTDAYFVASWNDTSNAESYLMKADGFTTDSNGIDKVDLFYMKGTDWTSLKDDAQNGSSISIGSLSLTVQDVSNTANTVMVAPGTGVNFNTIYSKEGLKIQLPYQNATVQTAGVTNAACTDVVWYPGLIGPVIVNNGTVTNNSGACYKTTFNLTMTEEDKNGNIGLGNAVRAVIGFNGATPTKLHVADVIGESATFEEQGSSDILESYVYSYLATKFLWDQSGSQYKLGVTYHGSESFANVFLASPEATITAGADSSGGSATALGQVTVFDNEVSAVQAKNLIVVGGSCINTVAAKLLGSDTPICGAAFTTATGVSDGQYLIQAFVSPYTAGKVAMLVAGYNAADTTKAVTYLTTNAVNSTIGFKEVKTSTTVAGTA